MVTIAQGSNRRKLGFDPGGAYTDDTQAHSKVSGPTNMVIGVAVNQAELAVLFYTSTRTDTSSMIEERVLQRQGSSLKYLSGEKYFWPLSAGQSHSAKKPVVPYRYSLKFV